MARPSINIVWFKRDLRIRDHGPLCAAIEAGLPTLLLFCMEPELMNAPDASPRHWRFAWQSAVDLQEQLSDYGLKLHICHKDAPEVFKELAAHFQIQSIFSHQETGNKASFDRDRRMISWCKTNSIEWVEFSQDGVLRGRKHRRGWAQRVERFLEAPLLQPQLKRLLPVSLNVTRSHLRRAALSGLDGGPHRLPDGRCQHALPAADRLDQFPHAGHAGYLRYLHPLAALAAGGPAPG